MNEGARAVTQTQAVVQVRGRREPQETLDERRSRLADAYRRSLYELAQAVDALEQGLLDLPAFERLQQQAEQRGTVWYEALPAARTYENATRRQEPNR